jgi:hypothetical protein
MGTITGRLREPQDGPTTTTTDRFRDRVSHKGNAQARLLRRIQRAEEIKAMTLRAAQTSGQQKGVTSIVIPVHANSNPKTCTEWQIMDVPSEVVHHLQQRNRTHFGQARGTPYRIPPLSTDLGFCGKGDGTQDILNGQYDTTGHNKRVKLLLNHLKDVDEIAHNPTFPMVSKAKFIGKLKVWRESTTTSLSGPQ